MSRLPLLSFCVALLFVSVASAQVETPEEDTATVDDETIEMSETEGDAPDQITPPPPPSGLTEPEVVPEPAPSPDEPVVLNVGDNSDQTQSPEQNEMTGDDEEPEQAPCDRLCILSELSETDPVFNLHRGPATLAFLGSIQLLAVPWIQDPLASLESGSIANTEGFRLRRARFGFEGQLGSLFAMRILFEHGADGARLLDTYLAFEPHPLARIIVGALKVPFSDTMLRSREYQPFLDRPYAVRNIAPDRSLGLRIDGRLHWLSYSAGIFNGGGDYYRGDNNDGMLYALRLAVHPLGPMPDGAVTQRSGIRFQVAGSYFFNQDAAGDRHAATGEAVLRWRGLTVRAEVLWSTFLPGAQPETAEGLEYGETERLGWFAEASYFIIAEHLEIAFRYGGQRVQEATEIRDLNDLWALTGAINGYLLQGRVMLSLEYQHRHEWFDEQGDNDFLAIQLQGRI